MPGLNVGTAFVVLLLLLYLLFGVLALLRCKRKDVRKILRTLMGRKKR